MFRHVGLQLSHRDNVIPTMLSSASSGEHHLATTFTIGHALNPLRVAAACDPAGASPVATVSTSPVPAASITAVAGTQVPLGKGASSRESNEILSQCYESHAPNGSVVYQRFSEFYGPLFEILVGQPHQAYGYNTEVFSSLPQPTYYGAGSRHIPLIGSPKFDPNNYCHRGHYETVWTGAGSGPPSQGAYVRNWLPGDCEGDLICAAACPTGEANCPKAQAYGCPEGYVCPAGTTALTQADKPCPGGYICDTGTTPDTSLFAPMGQYKLVCFQGYYCYPSTGPSDSMQQPCPMNFFCPTGTWDPFTGSFANDALNRGLSVIDSDPFANIVYINKRYNGVRFLMNVSLHDQRCNLAVDPVNLNTPTQQNDTTHTGTAALAGRIVVNGTVADAYAQLCARDHKWSWVALAQARGECDCTAQTAVVLEVWKLFKCTEVNAELLLVGKGTPPQCTYSAYPTLGIISGSTTSQASNWTSGAYGNETRTATLVPKLGAYATIPDFQLAGGKGVMPGYVLNWGVQLPPAGTYLAASTSVYGLTCESLWFPTLAEPYPGLGANRTWVGSSGTGGYWDQVAQVWVLNAQCSSRGDLFTNTSASPLMAPYWVRCPVFCSFSELKMWVDAVYASNASSTLSGKIAGNTNSRIPRLVFDLKYGVDLLDTFSSYASPTSPDDDPWSFGAGLTLPTSVVGWSPDALAGGILAPLRLDTCHCENTLRCPNGTTSNSQATSLYDCFISKQEVLRRFVPIPPGLYNPISGWDQMTNVTDPKLADLYTSNEGLGLVFLRGGQKLSLTLDFSSLPVNMTYATDYALTVYPDADSTPPCPPRYMCLNDRSDCSWPDAAGQAAFNIYCADQKDASGAVTSLGCCGASTMGTPDSLGPKTSPISMPYWLSPSSLQRADEPSIKSSGINFYRLYPARDNKHGQISFTFSAIRDITLLIALELYNGLYYEDFYSLSTVPGLCEAQIYEPYRASYSLSGKDSISDPRRTIKSFMAVIKSDATDLMLPYNLPFSTYRLPQAELAFSSQMENHVFIDRPADTRISQFNYWAQRSRRASGGLFIPSASGSITPSTSPSPSPSFAPADYGLGRRRGLASAEVLRRHPTAAAGANTMWQYISRESLRRPGVLAPLTSSDSFTMHGLPSSSSKTNNIRALRAASSSSPHPHAASYARALALGSRLYAEGPLRGASGGIVRRTIFSLSSSVRSLSKAIFSPVLPAGARENATAYPQVEHFSRGSGRRLVQQPTLLHEIVVAESQGLLYPHVYVNASRNGPYSRFQFGYWEPGIDYPRGGYEFGLWGTPLTLEDWTTPLARSEAARVQNAILGCPLVPGEVGNAPCKYVVDWYTGGSVFYARSGQGIPPNPYLLPFSQPTTPTLNYSVYYYRRDAGVDPGTGFMCQPTNLVCWDNNGGNQQMYLPGEAKMDYQWRIDVGLFCLDIEDALACAQRMQRIFSWWSTHANYRARPAADVVRDPLSSVERDVMWWTYGDTNGYNSEGVAFDHIMLPYLPFFSNCDGYDSHIDLSLLTEAHPDCTYLPPAQTIPVKGLIFEFQLFPKGDTCSDTSWIHDAHSSTTNNPGVPLYCTYEENVFVSAPKTRWYEAPVGTTIFYITFNATANSDFTGSASAGDFWGRNSYTQSVAGSDIAMVPVIVQPSTTVGKPSMVPRSVNLTLAYFQKTTTEKIIVTASMTFGNYCTVKTGLADIAEAALVGVEPCTANDFGYTLFFTFTPLWWLDLLNYFAFDFTAYLAVYIVIGMLIMFLGLVFYIVHRLTSRLRIKPKFRFLTLVIVILPAPVVGVLLATFSVFFVLFIYISFWLLTASSNPVTSPSMLEGISGNWDVPLESITLKDVNTYRLGRLGTSFIIFGVYALNLVATLLTPESSIAHLAHEDSAMDSAEEAEELEASMDELEADAERIRAIAIQSQASSVGGKLGVQGPAALYGVREDELLPGYTDDESFTPLRWKRAAMHMLIFFTVVGAIAYLNFSFSLEYFSVNATIILALIKTFAVLYNQVVRGTLRDALLCVPYTVVVLVVHGLSIQGSLKFFGYILNYLVVLASTAALRLYFFPWYNNYVITMPLQNLRWKLWFESGAKKSAEHRLADEQLLKAVTANCAVETESMEPILESYIFYSAEATALIMAPFFQVLIFLLDAYRPLQGTQGPFQITGIPGFYRINASHLFYYTIFSVVLIPTQLIMDVFLANALEVYHGWNFFEYVSFQRYRFGNRDKRWHMASLIVDTSITEHLQSADRMCFSSQYYFLIGSYAWSAVVLLLGIMIQFNAAYNMWVDWVNVINVAISLLIAILAKRLLYFLGKNCGLWARKTLDGTVEDEIGTNLAMSEGDAGALAVERIELAAMNSERFRRLFLDRAKPWLLSQLHVMLTPRMLSRTGTDGRPFKENVRDAYEQLIKMSEFAKMEADKRSSALTGDEAEEARKEEEQARSFSGQPAPNYKSKGLLLGWLADARRRLKLLKLARGIKEAARRPKCDLCGKHEGEVGMLRIDISSGGRYDPDAFSQIISSFDLRQRRLGISKDAPLDVPSWKSFFRASSEFIMRCEFCVSNRADTVRMLGQRKKFGQAARAESAVARVETLNALGLDADDDTVWDPVVITASGPTGRAMTKWLSAARGRIGGTFPKADARSEMEAYTKRNEEVRARKREKLSRAKGKVTSQQGEDGGPIFVGDIKLRASAQAIMLRLLFVARKRIPEHFVKRISDLTGELENLCRVLTPAGDWHFSTETRLKGIVLIGDGRAAKEAIERILSDRDSKVATLQRTMLKERRQLEGAVLRARAELASRMRAQETIFTEKEIKQMNGAKRSLATLQVSLKEVPDSSAAAADIRFRITTQENIVTAIRGAAAALRDDRVEKLKAGVEAQISEMEITIAERLVQFRRGDADAWTAANMAVRLTGGVFQINAMQWLADAREKQASFAEATRNRGRFGLSGMLGSLGTILGMGGSPGRGSPVSVASPRGSPLGTPGAGSPRSVAAGNPSAYTPRAGGRSSPTGTSGDESASQTGTRSGAQSCRAGRG